MEFGFGASHVPAVQNVTTGSGVPVTSLKAVDANTFLPATLVATAQVAHTLLDPLTPFHQDKIARFVAPLSAFRAVEKSEKEQRKLTKMLVRSVVINKTEQTNNHLGRGR